MNNNTKPRDGYTIVPNSCWVQLKDVPYAARLLWILLLTYENKGWAWPSLTKISEDLDCAVGYARKLVDILVQKGHIARKSGGKGKSNRYKLVKSCKDIQCEPIGAHPATEKTSPEDKAEPKSEATLPPGGHTANKYGGHYGFDDPAPIGATTSTITSTNKTSTTQRPPKVATPEEREVRSEAVERRTTDYYLRGYKRGVESIPAMWADLHWKSQGRDHYPLTPVEKKGVRQIWDWYWTETAGEVEQTMRNVFTCMARGWHCHEINRYPFTEGEVPTLSRVAQQLKMLEEVDYKALTKPRKSPQEREAEGRERKAKEDAYAAKERAWRDEQDQNIKDMVKRWE